MGSGSCAKVEVVAEVAGAERSLCGDVFSRTMRRLSGEWTVLVGRSDRSTKAMSVSQRGMTNIRMGRSFFFLRVVAVIAM